MLETMPQQPGRNDGTKVIPDQDYSHLFPDAGDTETQKKIFLRIEFELGTIPEHGQPNLSFMIGTADSDGGIKLDLEQFAGIASYHAKVELIKDENGEETVTLVPLQGGIKVDGTIISPGESKRVYKKNKVTFYNKETGEDVMTAFIEIATKEYEKAQFERLTSQEILVARQEGSRVDKRITDFNKTQKKRLIFEAEVKD
jgi:hypothetical protein